MQTMNNKFKKILLLYKRSAYRIYFLEGRGLSKKVSDPRLKQEMKYFQEIHEEHYRSLHGIIKVLMESGVRFDEAYRGKNLDYKKYDLIITVGGDGTFLEASRNVTNQAVLGVNSVPHHSVGNFCLTDLFGFSKVVEKIKNGKYKIEDLRRVRVQIDGQKTYQDALNDVLICHQNPAFLCRYSLKIGSICETQRSSGLWIATPSGSTGAVHSAGGRAIKRDRKAFQYKPRELYQGLFKPYKLKGGILSSEKKMEVLSLMRRGVIFIDGAHHKLSFEYGKRVKIGLSPQSLKTIRTV